MPIVLSRSVTRLLLAGVALAAAGCYQPEPLEPASAVAAPPPLDAARLTVRAESLKRPSLRSVRVDLSDGLNPDESAVLAVLLNPELRADRARHGEAEAQVVAAGVLPNPVFSAELDHPYGSGSAGLTNILNLSLALPLRGFFARGAKRGAAKAELARVDLGIAWREWQVAEQARLDSVRLGWIDVRLKIAREELAFDEQTAKTLERASASSDATLEQIGVQRAALESARRAVDALERAQVSTEGDLVALLGAPKGLTLSAVNPPLPRAPTPSLPDASALAPSCIEHRLDLEALRRAYAADEERLRQAALEQFPNVTIGVEQQHNENANNFIGGFVNFELPIFNHNQGPVAVGRATRARLRREYVARVTATRAVVVRLVALSRLLERQIPEVHASIAPLENIEQHERDAVDRGDISRLSYQTVREALLEQRLQEATLSQELAESEVALETECGGPVATPARAR